VIQPGVLLVRLDIISKLDLWTIAPKIDMLLEMMLVAILRALCKPCCKTRCATPEVDVGTENVLIPALGAGIVFTQDRLLYAQEYFVQHLSVCL
jgi:hypothetical protein